MKNETKSLILPQTLGNTYEYSRAVGSVAVHGLTSFEELNKTPEVVHGASLAGLVGEAKEGLNESFTGKLFKMLLNSTGLGEKYLQFILKVATDDKTDKVNLYPWFNTLNERVLALGPYLQQQLKDGKIPPELRDDVAKVAHGLMAKDKFLLTEINVELLSAAQKKMNVNLRVITVFIGKYAEFNIPELNVDGPGLTVELISKLQNYGLLKHLPLSRYFMSMASDERFGELYQKCVMDPYRGKPKRDEVSSLPYNTRLNDWETSRAEYESHRQALVPLLSGIKAHYIERGLFDGNYDVVWLRKNFAHLKPLIFMVLESKSLARVVAFTKSYHYIPKYDRALVSDQFPKYDSIIQSIRAGFNFAETTKTEEGDMILLSALSSFIELTMALYKLKPAKM